MLIELSNGKSIDSADPLFKKLSQEQQDALIAKQTATDDRRRRKALASQKCRALKKGLPWPPEQKVAEG